MKTAIVYSSQSGNTQKLAQAISDLAPNDKEIFAVDRAPEPIGYDLIAVRFWLQGGKPDPAASAFLSRIPENTKLFLFAMHGATPDSEHVWQAMMTARLIASQTRIVRQFSCCVRYYFC